MNVFLMGVSGYAGFHAALRLATKAGQAVSR
jgi:nucleoside-diphosphate-sugar epimerase